MLVQFTMTDGSHRSYATDPEMQVDPLVREKSEQDAIVARVKRLQRKFAARTNRGSSSAKPAKKKGGKRR